MKTSAFYCSWPVWHLAAHAEYLPGVCEKPPVQPANPGSLQTEPRLWQAAEAVRGQAGLRGEDSGDLPDLPHVPGVTVRAQVHLSTIQCDPCLSPLVVCKITIFKKKYFHWQLWLRWDSASVVLVLYCMSTDREQKQQAAVCCCSEYPCSVFHVYKKQCCFASFSNGSFLVRHAVSWQSTLLGPPAGCAV